MTDEIVLFCERKKVARARHLARLPGARDQTA